MNKNIISAILILAIALTFFGCTKKQPENSIINNTISSEFIQTDETFSDRAAASQSDESSFSETIESENTSASVSLTSIVTAISETVTSVLKNETTETSHSETTTKADISKSNGTCVISIKCTNASKNPEKLTNPAKASFIPANGIILDEKETDFNEGDTVFDILKKVCAENNIQLEFSYSSGFGSYYIEGINQLYEKDFGAESGWMYKVNNTFPNYGCSEYKIKSGDRIEWLYTLDLGDDVI